jgi:hypothetical protein
MDRAHWQRPSTYRPEEGLLTAAAAATIVASLAMMVWTTSYGAALAAVPLSLAFLVIVRRAPVLGTGAWLLYLTVEAELMRRGLSQVVASTSREILTGLLVIGGLYSARRAGQPVRVPLAAACVAAVVLVSLPRSPSLFGGLVGSRYYVLWPLLGFAGVRLFRTESRLLRFLRFVLLLLVPIASYGIVQYITGYGGSLTEADPAFFKAVRFGAFGSIGTTYGRPHFGLLMAVAALIAFWAMLKERQLMPVAVTGVLAALFVTACLVSLNRTAWISLAGASAVLVVVRLRLHARLLVLALSVPLALSLALIEPASGVGGGGLGRAVSERGSFGTRVEIWRDEALPLVDSPSTFAFGRGPGVVGGPLSFGSRRSLLPVADSSYVRVMVELGALGILALFIAISSIARTSLRLPRKFQALSLALISLFLIASITVDAIQVAPVLPLVWLIIGGTLGASGCGRRGGSVVKEPALCHRGGGKS